MAAAFRPEGVKSGILDHKQNCNALIHKFLGFDLRTLCCRENSATRSEWVEEDGERPLNRKQWMGRRRRKKDED